MYVKCEMSESCRDEASMVDADGYVYCERHGVQRRDRVPCRKMRANEIRRVERGERIARY